MFIAEFLPTSVPAETPGSWAGSPQNENLNVGAFSEQLPVGKIAKPFAVTTPSGTAPTLPLLILFQLPLTCCHLQESRGW